MLTGQPSAVDLRISNVTALIHTPEGAVDFLEHASIDVVGSTIAAIHPKAAAETLPVAMKTIDGRGKVAMPGLINCHTHSPMVLFRGAAEDVASEQWFDDYIWRMEVNLTSEDVELGAQLAIAEMIQAGVTTFVDHYFSMESVAKAVLETGIRANLGSCFFSSEGESGIGTSIDFARTYHGAAEGRITTSIAPHGVYDVTEEHLSVAAEAAERYGVGIHIHAAESRRQTYKSRYTRGVSPVEVLRRTGVLDQQTVIAHGKGIVPEDLPALAAARDHVGVACAAKNYMKKSPETTPVRMLRAWGVPVGMATDGAASNSTLDVWESMTAMGLVQKSQEVDPTWMKARQVLEHATLQSAQTAGLGESIGSLAPGRQADLILVDLTAPRVQPIHDLAAALVYSARSSDVVTTIVAGRVLMEDRQLMTLDLEAVLGELGPQMARLTNREHRKKIQDFVAE